MEGAVVRVPAGRDVAEAGELFGVARAAALVLLAPEEAAAGRRRASALQVAGATFQEELFFDSATIDFFYFRESLQSTKKLVCTSVCV